MEGKKILSCIIKSMFVAEVNKRHIYEDIVYDDYFGESKSKELLAVHRKEDDEIIEKFFDRVNRYYE